MGKKETKDQRLDEAKVLLALAAEKNGLSAKENKSVCLSPEVLAALVDNRCSSEEVLQIKKHISDCESCYQQWLTLSSLKLGSVKRVRIIPFNRARLYGSIGSALALAASVAIYLNVADYSQVSVSDKIEPRQSVIVEYQQGVKNRDLKPGEIGRLRQKPVASMDTVGKDLMGGADSGDAATMLLNEDKEVGAEPRAPKITDKRDATRALSKERVEQRIARTARIDTAKLKNKLKEIPQQKSRHVMKSMPVKTLEENIGPPSPTTYSQMLGLGQKKSLLLSSTPFLEWKNRVTEFCGDSDGAMNPLSSLIEDGLNLLENSHVTLSADSLKMTQDVLLLLRQMVEDKEWKNEECKEITGLLAEGAKSR